MSGRFHALLGAVLMLTVTALVAAGGAAGAWSSPGSPAPRDDDEAGRFLAVPVHVDVRDGRLAAYQFELRERDDRMRVVGVENGEHAAFAKAPYFDRQAVEAGTADRIIVAAFSTNAEDELPTGRTRVATVHVHLASEGEPQWEATLVRAGNAAGEAIEASITVGAETEGENE